MSWDITAIKMKSYVGWVKARVKMLSVEKISYLAIAASPGAFKICVLAAVGVLSDRVGVQGEIANDLAIISFVSMLTAIGAGLRLLHLIPKEKDSREQSAKLLKGAIIKLCPFIVLTCVAIYFSSTFGFDILNNGKESAVLLFAVSIYWLFRHFFLARANKTKLIALELLLWSVTVAGFAVIYLQESFSSPNVTLIIAGAYLISIFPELISLSKVSANYDFDILKDSLLLGLSNLVSGGLVSLAPSIAYHTGGPALAGIIALISNILSITLTAIRAYLLKSTPLISDVLATKNGFKEVKRKVQRGINIIMLVCSLALLPLAVLTVIKVQAGADVLTVAIYSLSITAFICIPQFAAVSSLAMAFIGSSGLMLGINIIQSALVFMCTSIAFYYMEPHVVFPVFLCSFALFNLFRNYIVTLAVLKVCRHKF